MAEKELVSWTMRDNATGEIRSGKMHDAWALDVAHEDAEYRRKGTSFGNAVEFHWLENNNACDSNRCEVFYGYEESERIHDGLGRDSDTCGPMMPDGKSYRFALLKLECAGRVVFEGEHYGH